LKKGFSGDKILKNLLFRVAIVSIHRISNVVLPTFSPSQSANLIPRLPV